jgi:fibronectin-binding autotransporter adhesin
MRLHIPVFWAAALLLVWMAGPPPGHADCAAGDGNLTSPGLCTTPQNLTGTSGGVVSGVTLGTGPNTTAYTISSNNSTVTNSGTISSAGSQAVLMSGSANTTSTFAATLTNSGAINAPQGTAIVVNPGQTLNLTNTGTITGGTGTAVEYIQAPFQGSGTINQVAGTITGAISFAGVLNVTGGAINGPIVGVTTIPSGATGSSFTTGNLGSVDFDLGSGSFTTAGALGVSQVSVQSGTLVLANDVTAGLSNNATLRISGTRTVGSFTQTSRGTLVMAISPQDSSQLRVVPRFIFFNPVPGSAVLAGTLALDYALGTYTPRSYTLISVGGVTGLVRRMTRRLRSPAI